MPPPPKKNNKTNLLKEGMKTPEVIKTMVGDVEYAETNWGNEEAQISKVLIGEMDSSANIRVALRCRPPNKRELAGGDGGGIVVKVPGPNASNGTVVVEGNAPFKYDLAFPMKTSQLEVFEAIGVDIVQCALNGYNGNGS
jgi:hypothetical protein